MICCFLGGSQCFFGESGMRVPDSPTIRVVIALSRTAGRIHSSVL